jgi:hypothetical protein
MSVAMQKDVSTVLSFPASNPLSPSLHFASRSIFECLLCYFSEFRPLKHSVHSHHRCAALW